MRRFAPCLLLIIAPVSAAWADDAFTQSQRGACVYSGDAPPARSAPAAMPRSSAVAHTPRAAQQSVPAAPASTGSGGGGNEDDLMERIRAPRWHSFLPGMFR